MFDNDPIAGALQAALHSIEVPACPLAAIRTRIAFAPPPLPERQSLPQTLLVALGAIAAVLALAFVAFPSTTLGFVESVEQKTAEILWWTPPPAPPTSLSSTVASRAADLTSAQARVGFRIVPPAGLPPGITRARVWTTPALVYSKVTHAWSKGEPSVIFAYDRTRGRSFMLIADRFDPRFGPPPRYLYENDSTGGRMLVKHLNFAWRNGDQSMGVNASQDISATEIIAIRTAMHGTPIAAATTRAALNSGTLVKQLYVGEPEPKPH